MKRQYYLLLVSTLFIFSCKKDRLKDDKAIFIGNWKWTYTESTGDFCSGNPTSTSIIYPSTYGQSMNMHFYKKGKVTFSYANGKIREKRIVFNQFNATNGELKNSYNFVIYLNNDADSVLYGEINHDTILLTGYLPFSYNPCTIDRNYFTRN